MKFKKYKLGGGIHGNSIWNEYKNIDKTARYLLWFIRDMKELWFSWCVLIVLVNAASIISVVSPFLISNLIDQVLVRRQLHLFICLTLALIGLYVLQVGLWAIKEFLQKVTAQRAILRLRINLYKKITKMKCYFYLRHPTGELISRLENDVNLTEVFASHLLVSLINEALMVVYTLSAIAVLNVYLAFGVFAVFLLLLFVQKRYSTRVRASALRTREAQANLLATLQETLSGLEWIQNVAGEKKAAIRYIHRAKKVIMRNLEGTRISVIASSILGLNGNDHVWCWRIFGTKGCFYARHVGSI